LNTSLFDSFLDDARQNHFKLLIIPEEEINKEEVKDFLKERGWKLYNLTQELLAILEKIPKEKRRLRASIEFEKWLHELDGSKFLFDNIELLFSPEIGKIDPIRMLKYFSRDHTSVMFFPGKVRGKQAEYSIEGKEDYMIMDVSEVLCYSEQDREEEN
jgi:hypothetical protein